MTASSVIYPYQVVPTFSVRQEGVDLFHTDRWGYRWSRLFSQVVQTVLFPIGIYRYFSLSTPWSAKKVDRIRERYLESFAQCLSESVAIETADGARLDTLKIESNDQRSVPIGEQKWVLFLNAPHACLENNLTHLESLANRHGFNVFSGNFRGRGHSQGYQWSDQDSKLDAEAMVQYLLSLGVREENIEIQGFVIKDDLARSLQEKHPAMIISEMTQEIRALAKMPKVSFKAIDERSMRTFLKEGLTHLFWEVVYFFLLPLEAIRYAATKFAILPCLSQFSKEEVDEFRGASFERVPADMKIHRIAVRTADRVTLDTCEIIHPNQPKEASAQQWIIFFNGNGACYEGMLDALAKLSKDTGANIYTGNYRGVGYSKGFPWTANHLNWDGEAMVQRLLQEGVKPENILLHGWSLGGAVAANVAAKHSGMHLCSDRSFSTFKNEVREMLGQYFSKGIAKVAASLAHFIGWDFDSVGAYDKVLGRKFVVYHPCDGVIPYKASLYYGQKQKHMTKEDRAAKALRAPLKAEGKEFDDEYSITYKPERIRLESIWENWNEESGAQRAKEKRRETQANGQAYHCSFLSSSEPFSRGYRQYLAQVQHAFQDKDSF